MKTMQRTLSLILAMVMLLGCMVFAASAEEAASKVELYSAGKLIGGYETLQDALAAYDSATQYVVLKADITADITLSQDLCIDLAGYDLSGSINLNGFALYGMDSTTDGYTAGASYTAHSIQLNYFHQHSPFSNKLSNSFILFCFVKTTLFFNSGSGCFLRFPKDFAAFISLAEVFPPVLWC